MKKYDYIENMKKDIKDALESYDLTAYDSREELESELHDSLWKDDSVTGNGSGEYTDNKTAKDYLEGNDEILKEAMREFCVDSSTIIDKWFSDDYNYFDVTIRCYLLGQAISELLDELEIQ